MSAIPTEDSTDEPLIRSPRGLSWGKWTAGYLFHFVAFSGTALVLSRLADIHWARALVLLASAEFLAVGMGYFPRLFLVLRNTGRMRAVERDRTVRILLLIWAVICLAIGVLVRTDGFLESSLLNARARSGSPLA